MTVPPFDTRSCRKGVPVPRTPRRIGGVLLPLALVVVAACSAGPSDRPAVAYRGTEQQVAPAPQPPRPDPVPRLGPPARNALNWRDCTDRTRRELGVSTLPGDVTFSCTRLLTSLDPPGSFNSGTSRMALLGVGTGSIPLVVVNDIRGEPGTTFAARLALRLPPRMLETFRIIGVDRRGTGESDPVGCVPPEDRAAITGFDPLATSRRALDRLLDSVRSASQECLLELEERAQSYDTRRAATDLEELRIELGVPRLHAIGRGEGSRVLTTYAQRFPDSVGRMVLDGAPDPMLDALARTRNQARSAEKTLDEFARECAGDGSCPLGPDPRKTISSLVRRTTTQPLRAPDGPVTAGTLVRALLVGLKEPDRWPELVRALDAAQAGDGAPIAAIVAPLLRDTASGPARFDARMITRCNDTMARVPPQRSARLAAEWVAQFPVFGGVFVQRLVQCSLWPVPQRPLPDPSRPGLPPMPVITTATDPLTPAMGSERMADLLASGVTVSWQGAGHGALGRSPCITSAVVRYLLDGTVPAQETVCPA